MFRCRYFLLRIELFVTMGFFTRGSASDTGEPQTLLVPCPRHSCATADYSSYFMLSFPWACFVALLLRVVEISVVRCSPSVCLILHNESQVRHRAVHHRTWWHYVEHKICHVSTLNRTGDIARIYAYFSSFLISYAVTEKGLLPKPSSKNWSWSS